MEKSFIVLCFLGWIFSVLSAPKMRVIPQLEKKPLITSNLPANWTNIRDEVVDTFKCEGKSYGYYADVDNDCQIFHVCLPVEGRNFTFRWSFICPGETIFNQESFTCTRAEDSVKCEDAPDFYKLNDNFGQIDDKEDNERNEDKPNAIDTRFFDSSGREQMNKRRNKIR